MKTVLCYGDSLTWGMNAATWSRHAHEDLWPTVVGQRLGPDVLVINAGLNGRTTIFDDHAVAADRNGARVLPTVLATFEPIDAVVLMLGSNDLKTWISGSAVAAAQGMKRLVELVRTYSYLGQKAVPEVLLIAPPAVLTLGPTSDFPLQSPRTAEWPGLAPAYRRVAEELKIAFFDAGTVASAEGGGDGVHLDARNSRAIGEAVAPVIAGLLKLETTEAA
jgi:lysophospholipase L1-like esterase